MDAEPPGPAVFGEDFDGPGLALQIGCGEAAVDTAALGDDCQRADVADVDALGEICAKQRLGERVASSCRSGETDQPMSAQGIGGAPDALEGKVDAFRTPGRGNRGLAAHGLAHVTEFRREKEIARDAAARGIGFS